MATYLKHLFEGSLGRSFSMRRSVSAIVIRAAPVTASVIAGGLLIWLTIGLAVGVYSAVHPRSLLDRVAMVGVLIGISAHPIWIGLVLGYLLGFKAQLFPIGGSVLEVLDEDYVRTARAKGAGEWHVLRHHVLRTALLPVVTMLGMGAGLALGGAAFVEVVYGLPGLGHVAFEHLGFLRSVDTGAYTPLDLPVTAGIVVVMTIAIIVFNLLVDLAYGWIDPRIDVPGTRRARSF